MEYLTKLLIKNDLKNHDSMNYPSESIKDKQNIPNQMTDTISKYKAKIFPNERIEREVNIECLNFMELSKKIKLIKETFFQKSKNDNKEENSSKEIAYYIKILTYKKVNTDKIICEIFINKLLIKLEYITTFLMKATKKVQKQEFCGNLIEELVSLFNPIQSIYLYSDSINFITNTMYTLKNLCFEMINYKFTNKNLFLDNLFFNIDSENEKKYLRSLFEQINSSNQENFRPHSDTFEIMNIKANSFFNELKMNFYIQEEEDLLAFFEEIILNLINSADFFPANIKINNQKSISYSKNEKMAIFEFLKYPKIKKINLSFYFNFDKLLQIQEDRINSNDSEENLFSNLVNKLEEKVNKCLNNKKSFLFIQRISLEFINTNPSTKVISDGNNIAANNLAYFFLLNFIPNFLEIKIVEIINKNNSTLSDNQALFKFNKTTLSKEFLSLFNKIKQANLIINTDNEKRKNFQKIFFSFIESSKIKNEKTDSSDNPKLFALFANDLKYLQINLEILKKNKEKIIKPQENSNLHNQSNKSIKQLEIDQNFIKDAKIIFQLKENFENILIRKIKSENLYKIITEKPLLNKASEQNLSELEKLENIIHLKPYDLITLSDIFSKLEGNKILFLKDGRKISIGGKFNLTIYGKSFQIILNTIIEISADYSSLRIFTFNENYFLPMFNFAAEKLDLFNLLKDGENKKDKLNFLSDIESKCKDFPKINLFLLKKIKEFNSISNLKDIDIIKNKLNNKLSDELIFITGGMSQQELISNFYFTPVFIVNALNFDIFRVLPDKDVCQMFPGVTFSHEIRINIENQKFLIENFGGFRIENFVGGIKIGESIYFNLKLKIHKLNFLYLIKVFNQQNRKSLQNLCKIIISISLIYSNLNGF